MKLRKGLPAPLFAPNTRAAWALRFGAYFGNNFSHRWLNALPEDVIVRQRDGGRGVCRYHVADGYETLAPCGVEIE